MLCSEHFKREDFIRSADLGDEKNHHTSKRWLKVDDLGVNVFQSVHVKTTVNRLVLRGSERNIECQATNKRVQKSENRGKKLHGILLSMSQLYSPQFP